MSIATRWLDAFNKSVLSTARARQRQWQRLYSSRVDLPPHLDRSSIPATTPRALTKEFEQRIKPYYITTPIFYPNAVPHIGHLYSLVIADIFARHARLAVPDRSVHFITGTDEHGQKIQKAAQERNMHPQEFCDRLGVAFSNLTHKALISHTSFVRTTSEDHRFGVQTLWSNLVNSGNVHLGEHSGWYSISDECFYTDSQIRTEVDPNTRAEKKVSVETGSVVEWTKEENYKFALSNFKGPLLEHFKANPEAIYPPCRRKEIIDILESHDPMSLPDLSISRPSSRLKWGIPVPGDSSHTIYVWLDALTSYLTGVGYPWFDDADMSSMGWPVDLQIVGKDILKFHAIYFPAFLMALDLPLPRALLSHAHWTVNKAKMSKSVGNVVDPIKALKEHGVDAVRWYLARSGGYFKSDIDWNDDQVVKFATELRSLLGNVLLRLQSPKVLDRLPPAFHQIPLHRAVLMTRGNARAPLSEPGSEEYDDILEDRLYSYERRKAEVDYAEEYTNRLAHSDGHATGLAQHDPIVLRYSDLPEPDLDSEALIVSSELRDSLDMLRGKVCSHLQRFEVGEATQSIVDVLSLLNKEITRIRPWSRDTQPRDVIHLLIWGRETLRICGILMQPFMPVASQALLDAQHVNPRMRDYSYACIGAGRVRSGPLEKYILFPSKGQRAWNQVEADHKWEENRKRIEAIKRSEQIEPLPKKYRKILYRPLNKTNRLYSQHFNPSGSRAKLRAEGCFKIEPELEPDEEASSESDPKKHYRRRLSLKAEKQKRRSSI